MHDQSQDKTIRGGHQILDGSSEAASVDKTTGLPLLPSNSGIRRKQGQPAGKAQQIWSRDGMRRVVDLMVALLATSTNLAFGLPGGTIAPLNDALMISDRVRSITVRHENAGAYMAAGYARMSGRPGAVIVTSGPGVLNCMNGLASARCDGIPLIVLVGEVARGLHGKRALQDGAELGILQMLGSVTKWATEVPDPNAAIPMLRRAIQIATTEPRGPVALTLPLDVMNERVLNTQVHVASPMKAGITTECLESVLQAFATSQRIAILAGSGVRSGDGPAALLELAESQRCPVMTTPKAKGVFPESHWLSLGVFGLGGHPSARRYLQEGVDSLLAVGTSLGEFATEGWSPLLRPRHALIHVDVDAGQIGRSYATDLAIEAPAGAFMRALQRRLPPRSSNAKLRYGVDYYQNSASPGNGPEGRISPIQAIREIQQILPADTVFAVDSGEHSSFATHYLRIDDPDSYIAMTGLGSMGSSICAVGAKLARPDRTVAVICGDGGYAMIATEIGTASRLGLDIVFFVFNDRRLGMVELGNTRIFGRTPGYSTEPLDVPGLARSVGARTAVVEHADEILALDLRELLNGRPLVVDVRIDRMVQMPHNRRFESLMSMSRSGAQWPLEMPANELFEPLRDFSNDEIQGEEA